MNCLLESFASLWIGFIHTVNRKALESDLVAVAKEQLRETIATMQDQIHKHNVELVDITNTVREQRPSLSKERLKTLLLKSKRARTAMSTIHNKLTLMESQLDTLENNDVNKTILTTLQTSAKAMKKMGLANDLRKTDEVISELEQSMEHAHDINSTVSTSISQFDSGIDDDSLEMELDILLGIEPTPPATVLLSQQLPGGGAKHEHVSVAPPSVTNSTVASDNKDDTNDNNNPNGSMELADGGGEAAAKTKRKIASIPEQREEEEEEQEAVQAT